MNTPAILNPISVQNSAKQSSRQADSGTPEVSFNQVLSREVAGNREAARQQRPAQQPQAQKQMPAQARNQVQQQAHAPDAARQAHKPAEKDKAVKDKAGKTDDATTGTEASDAAAAEAASAQGMTSDLLALVAGINQMTQAPADAVAADTGDALAGGKTVAPADIGLAADDKRPRVGAAGEDLRARPDAAQTATTADFAATLTDMTASADADGAALAVTPDAARALAEARDTAAQAAQTPQALTALQQAAAHVAHAAPGRASDRLAPHVGTPGWDQALAQKVVWMVAGAEQSASLTLNPPDLGPLQVVLNVSNAQATASFVAAQPEVRQALEDAMPKLREMLGQAGIELGQATVNSGSPGQNGEAGRQAHGNRHGGRAIDDGTDTAAAIAPVRGRAISSGEGLVDTFV